MDPEAPSRSKIAERRRKIKAGFLQGKREQGTDESPDDLANTPTSQDAPQRIVHINDPKTTNESYEYAGNQVRTSKYTLISFLPRNLFEQFHRVAYLYFLAIVILNQIPQLAVFGRTASVFPLVFVLLVTAIKDTYEDWGRRKSDVKENNRLCLVMQDDHFAPKKWKHIQVGDIVKVCEDETIPCDLVLLATSDSNGLAYVQTINLDGESNLKTRYAKQETIARHPELGSFVGRLECETPNRNIYEFTAFVDLDGVTVPLGPNNIILRGCELKNTPWVVGVVVYAGQETKAMLNSSGAQSKRSRLEKQMNREIAWLAAFLITMSVVGGLGLGLWIGRHEDELNVIPYYVKTDYSTGKTYQYSGRVGEAIFGFLSCIIVFQIMVPISLYISMELVRLGQCYFMTQDLDMYYGPSNTHFQARALTINEDLGQIKYLFSDKTGTLTENRMEFQTSSIYGVDYADARIHSDTVVVTEGAVEPGDSGDAQGPLVNQAWRPKVGAKLDPRLVHILQGPDNTIEWRAAHDFLLALAACNTVVPTSLRATSGEQTEVDVESAGAIRYQAESPDEQALVVAAAAYGFILLERTSEYLVINVLGNTQRFDVLGVHEFDSTRKCMSVVLKCPDGTLQGFVKGADTAVLDRIASVSNKAPSASTSKQFDEVLAATLAHLDRYAREGLRTLVVASKLLDSSEFETWKSMHEKASISIMNRVGMMRSAAEVVESNLVLLGATGIEDRLQEGVPETIAALREAGIKIWVLTGDKQETAISIGFSCLLLTRDMHQIIINATTKDGCREALRQAKVTYRVQLQKIQTQENADPGKPTTGPGSWTNQNGGLDNHSDQQETRDSQTGGNAPLALIIDGNSLVYALSEDLEDELLDLAMSCKVVVCCRVAPLQKAGLVSLVKRKTKEMTLAVGDGANDVSMIQMADVGVGISGQEGRQAVMASDFALGQFKYLKKLLLVHGHWNYQRLGYMVLYNFYRNAVFVTMLFWYIIYTAFSPISALSDWNLVFYSFIYTSVPTIVVGILDKDIVSTTLLAYPALYGSGHREEAYNKLLFWATILDTLWQSLVLFFVPFFTYQSSTMDTFSIGDLWTISVVVVVNVNLALNIRTWTWIHHVAVWGSIVATFISLLVMDAIKVEGVFRYHWAIFHLASTAEFWLDIILLVVLALLPQFFIQAVKQRFRPSDIDIAREFEIEVRSRNVTERPSVELHEVRHSPNPESTNRLPTYLSIPRALQLSRERLKQVPQNV